MTARRTALAGAGALLLLTGGAGRARAHELTPSLLSIVERGAGDYDVLWRVPVDEGPRGLFTPILPTDDGSARPAPRPVPRPAPRSVSSDSQARYESWSLHLPGGLPGRAIALDGPPGAASDALVRIVFLDGRAVHGRLAPGGPPFVVPAAPSRLGTAATYLRLGVEHILLGFDHLLFVLGLLLLTPTIGSLVRTITAFTAAHSVTLALAALGVLRVPQPPVEATIALSIVFVAREAVVGSISKLGSDAASSLAARRPWTVALLFGLLHGLGFASALSDIGLPAGEVPLALAAFNIGVEAGQLAFVVAVLAGVLTIVALLTHLSKRRTAAAASLVTAARARALLGYGIGALAAALCVARVATVIRPP